jgi:hypothetical protein
VQRFCNARHEVTGASGLTNFEQKGTSLLRGWAMIAPQELTKLRDLRLRIVYAMDMDPSWECQSAIDSSVEHVLS